MEFLLQIDSAFESKLGHRLKQLKAKHQHFIDKALNLDLTRGKPSSAQLDLSNALFNALDIAEVSNNPDFRNYGIPQGIPAAKKLFGNVLGLSEADCQNRVFIGGNSSLTLMHYSIWFAFYLGIVEGAQSWQSEQQQTGQPIKILCPCPGYDRHFTICSDLGIEMIPVRLTGSGPDMDQVETLIKADAAIKGIWCVPRFSNPTGEVYNDKTVQRLAELPNIAGNNFYVLWDNAYALHALIDTAEPLANIDIFAKQANTLNSIIQFGSTSKITFAGAGVGFMASGEHIINGFTKRIGSASIGADKINQLRHVNFLHNINHIKAHMQNHAAIIGPKFSVVQDMLEQHFSEEERSGKSPIAEWSNPEGGYFISFNTRPKLAKKVIALAAEAGVKLTPAGSTFPNRFDPEDKNIRIAPTYPELADLKNAMEVFVNCVKLASIEQELH